MGSTPHAYGGPYQCQRQPLLYQTLSAEVWNNYHFPALVCPDASEPPNAEGGCGEPSFTPEQCAGYLNEYSYPVPGPTPAAICAPNGCTMSADPDGALCDMLGENCHLQYSTAAAATNYAYTADARFAPTCTPGGEPGETAADSDGDGTPNTEDAFDDDPAESKDTDGDGVGDNADAFPTDADNGEDTTGTESDNTSSGGGNCSAPPVSSGDGIAAQIAYQTWATRCAVERLHATTAKAATDASSGGSVSVDMTATNGKLDTANTKAEAGNALATEGNAKLAGIQSNTASGAAKLAQISDGAAADMSVGDLEGVPGAVASGSDSGNQEFGAEGLDETGYGAGSTCPVPQSFDVMGQTFTPDISIFCDFMEITGLLVLALGAFASVRIMGSA